MNRSATNKTSVAATVFIKQEDGSEELHAGSNDFEKTCRFCLTIPRDSEIESPTLNERIATMYKTLTGIEVSFVH